MAAIYCRKPFYVLFLTSFLYMEGFCFADSLYESLVNAQDVLKELSLSVGAGLKTLGQTVKFMEKFVDSTLEEDCVFKCPGKREVPVGNPLHTPQVDGCGAMGMYLEEEDLPQPQMAQCCDAHDICYDTCGTDKEDCDKQFKRCLYSSCDLLKESNNKLQHKMCQGGAKLLYTATMTLGCTSFKEAQGRACNCHSMDGDGKKSNFKKPNRREL